MLRYIPTCVIQCSNCVLTRSVWIFLRLSGVESLFVAAIIRASLSLHIYTGSKLESPIILFPYIGVPPPHATVENVTHTAQKSVKSGAYSTCCWLLYPTLSKMGQLKTVGQKFNIIEKEKRNSNIHKMKHHPERHARYHVRFCDSNRRLYMYNRVLIIIPLQRLLLSPFTPTSDVITHLEPRRRGYTMEGGDYMYHHGFIFFGEICTKTEESFFLGCIIIDTLGRTVWVYPAVNGRRVWSFYIPAVQRR
jgi:hypothetical protein